jgi:predicted ATPase
MDTGKVLTSLSIENFKAWRKTGPIPLAPLTVFFGSNSSGKSSILQFLRLLQQTVQSPDRTQVLATGDRNSSLFLGGYTDWIHGHQQDSKLKFELSWRDPEPVKISETVSSSELAFGAEIGNSSVGRTELQHFAYRLGDQYSIKLQKQSNGAYETSDSPSVLYRSPGKPWPLYAPTHFYGFPDEIASRYVNASFTSDLSLSLLRQLRNLHYLGPLRTKPERSYFWSGERPLDVGFDGANSVPALLAAGDVRISRAKHQHTQSLREAVADWLRTFGLAESFSAKPTGASQLYEVGVRASGTKTTTSLPDVGFGVSQALPVIVEVLYAQSNSTLIIEQPELHLHPRAAAYLADLFTQSIHSRIGGKDRELQMLIETHSEHFVYRLQRLIAEKKVSETAIAFFVCRPGSEGSTIERLRINEFGDIENWPDDFFGDEMTDTRMRLEAISSRLAEA